MDNLFLLYLIKVSIALALFYILYMLCLKQDTFLKLRRGFFLFAIFFSFIFPLFTIEIPVEEEANIAIPAYYWMSQLDAVVTSDMATESGNSAFFTLTNILYFSLALITLFLTIRFLIQICSIYRLKAKNDVISNNDCRVVRINHEKISPFSFFNWIFIGTDIKNEDNLSEIIAHEMVHVKQYHSIDVVIAELMCIFFWWNPFAWLLKKELKMNLEYLADKGVLENGFDSKQYQYLLLQVSNKNTGIPIINNFNVSQLKKRIAMMNKKKSSILFSAKYLMVIPLCMVLLLSNAIYAAPELINYSENLQEQFDLEKKANLNDVNPSFPGGEKEMIKFIKENLKYPVRAKTNSITGRIHVAFTVKSNGEKEDVKAVRTFDSECEAEAIRIVKTMPNWIPGKENGKPVNVRVVIPVNFNLSDNSKKDSKNNEQIVITERKNNTKDSGKLNVNKGKEEVVVVSYSKINQDSDPQKTKTTVHTKVDVLPSYPGGNDEMYKFIGDNLVYPTKAQVEKKEGRVTIRFIVRTNGDIEEVKVIKGIDPECDAEALRVVKNMPKWIPGKKDGKNVDTYYILPFLFRLKGDNTDKKP